MTNKIKKILNDIRTIQLSEETGSEAVLINHFNAITNPTHPGHDPEKHAAAMAHVRKTHGLDDINNQSDYHHSNADDVGVARTYLDHYYGSEPDKQAPLSPNPNFQRDILPKTAQGEQYPPKERLDQLSYVPSTHNPTTPRSTFNLSGTFGTAAFSSPSTVRAGPLPPAPPPKPYEQPAHEKAFDDHNVKQQALPQWSPDMGSFVGREKGAQISHLTKSDFEVKAPPPTSFETSQNRGRIEDREELLKQYHAKLQSGNHTDLMDLGDRIRRLSSKAMDTVAATIPAFEPPFAPKPASTKPVYKDMGHRVDHVLHTIRGGVGLAVDWAGEKLNPSVEPNSEKPAVGTGVIATNKWDENDPTTVGSDSAISTKVKEIKGVNELLPASESLGLIKPDHDITTLAKVTQNNPGSHAAVLYHKLWHTINNDPSLHNNTRALTALLRTKEHMDRAQEHISPLMVDHNEYQPNITRSNMHEIASILDPGTKGYTPHPVLKRIAAEIRPEKEEGLGDFVNKAAKHVASKIDMNHPAVRAVSDIMQKAAEHHVTRNVRAAAIKARRNLKAQTSWMRESVEDHDWTAFGVKDPSADMFHLHATSDHPFSAGIKLTDDSPMHVDAIRHHPSVITSRPAQTALGLYDTAEHAPEPLKIAIQSTVQHALSNHIRYRAAKAAEKSNTVPESFPPKLTQGDVFHMGKAAEIASKVAQNLGIPGHTSFGVHITGHLNQANEEEMAEHVDRIKKVLHPVWSGVVHPALKEMANIGADAFTRVFPNTTKKGLFNIATAPVATLARSGARAAGELISKPGFFSAPVETTINTIAKNRAEKAQPLRSFTGRTTRRVLGDASAAVGDVLNPFKPLGQKVREDQNIATARKKIGIEPLPPEYQIPIPGLHGHALVIPTDTKFANKRAARYSRQVDNAVARVAAGKRKLVF